MTPRESRWLIVAFALFSIGFSCVAVAAHFRGKAKDYGKWDDIGHVVLAGGDLYTSEGGGRGMSYMYPPLFAILMAPLAAAGRIWIVLVLVTLFTAAWGASVLLSIWLTTGRVRNQPWVLYVVPSTVCSVYLWDAYLLGQPNVVLGAMLLAAFALLRARREWSAGALVALAASLKAFPVLALGYLLWRRYWIAAASTVLCLVVFILIVPGAVRGMERTIGELKTWSGAMIRQDDGGIAQRANRGNSWKNQSLLAVANRLLRPVDADSRLDREAYVNVATVSLRTVQLVSACAALALCLFYIWAIWGTRPKVQPQCRGSYAIETAMLMILIVLFSPLSFIYFYVWLIHPLTVAVHLCVTAPAGSRVRAMRLAWVGGIVALLSLSLWSDWGRGVGNTFWACVVLLVGLGLANKAGRDDEEQVRSGGCGGF